MSKSLPQNYSNKVNVSLELYEGFIRFKLLVTTISGNEVRFFGHPAYVFNNLCNTDLLKVNFFAQS